MKKPVSAINRPLLNHQIIEVFDVKVETLSDVKILRALVNEITRRYSFKILKSLIYKFSDKGITLMYLLSESHLVIHTWPEMNYLHIDLLTCDKFPLKIGTTNLQEIIQEILHSSNVIISQINIQD